METKTAVQKNGVNGNGVASIQKKVLPSYQELASMELDKENELMVFLNQAPPEKWIRQNKFANNSNYLPIANVEYLLSRIFVKWWIEILDYKIIANSICCHVRLFVINPITKEPMHTDGVGAVPLQTNEGAGATDFTQIKNSSVQMALPMAKSYALKDAAETFGRLFGKDLNRKDLISYESLSGRFQEKTAEQKEAERLAMLINNAQSKEQLTKLKKNIPIENQELKELYNIKLQTLN